MIEEGACQALGDLSAVAPYVPASPVTITVEFGHFDTMAAYSPRSDVVLDQPAQKMYSRADDWMSAWDKIWPF